MELLIVLGIISLLSAVVMASVASARARSRDAEVRNDVQIIKLALVRAREASPTFSYPGTSGNWYCLKASGSCSSSPTYSANTVVTNALTPYLPGGKFPQPRGTSEGQKRHDAYFYSPSQGSPYNGAVLVWAQEKTISSTDCNGPITSYESGINYCYEILPTR